jgi:hypothetical protein
MAAFGAGQRGFELNVAGTAISAGFAAVVCRIRIHGVTLRVIGRPFKPAEKPARCYFFNSCLRTFYLG